MWGKPYKYRGDGTVTLERKWRKVGRNEICPCKSGLKYKNCCGLKSVKDPMHWYLPWLAVIALLLAIYTIAF